MTPRSTFEQNRKDLLNLPQTGDRVGDENGKSAEAGIWGEGYPNSRHGIWGGCLPGAFRLVMTSQIVPGDAVCWSSRSVTLPDYDIA